MFILQRRRPEVWALPKANWPQGVARSHDAGRNIETKVLSYEEAVARVKALGLPPLEINGDYGCMETMRNPMLLANEANHP